MGGGGRGRWSIPALLIPALPRPACLPCLPPPSAGRHHAQLREVHGANMRAADVLLAEEEDAKSRRQKRVLDPDMVNSLMQDVIRDIATEGELVTKEKVKEESPQSSLFY